MMKRPYQCGIAVYQLAKLRMLEFCYDFLDRHFSRQEFELCYMASDLLYFPMSGDCLDEIAKAELSQACGADKKNWLARGIFNERTPGLIKPGFGGTRGVT